MSDLEGMDALNRLLEELLDATRTNAVLRDERDTAIRSGREAAEVVRVAQERGDRIERETARNVDTLRELHEAAAAIPDLTGSEGTVLNMQLAAIIRLKAALGPAAKLCGVDDLPF